MLPPEDRSFLDLIFEGEDDMLPFDGAKTRLYELRFWLDLRAERSRVDDELATLAPVILAALEWEDDGRLNTQGLTLEARIKRTYTYSDEVVETEAYLKDLRAAERANGIASPKTATGYVQVSVNRLEAIDHARTSISKAERVLTA